MSWKHVNMVLLTKRPRWTTATQQALLVAWAQFYREDWGYAIWSYRKLHARLGLKRARLNRVTRELEALGVGGRLPDGLGCGGENRYFILPEAFEDRRFRDVGPPVIAGEVRERRGFPVLPAPKPRTPSLFDVVEPPSHVGDGAILQDQGPAAGVAGGADPPGSGTLILQDQEKYTVPDLSTRIAVDPGTETATAASQPRLDALVGEVRAKRHRHLSTEPQTDGNFKAVCRAVRDVLASPALGARLLKRYDATVDADICEAVRRLCDRRHVRTGAHPIHKADLITRALNWERARQAITAGGQRPRDLAKRKGRR